jgi:hypothetical protein
LYFRITFVIFFSHWEKATVFRMDCRMDATFFSQERCICSFALNREPPSLSPAARVGVDERSQTNGRLSIARTHTPDAAPVPANIFTRFVSQRRWLPARDLSEEAANPE